MASTKSDLDAAIYIFSVAVGILIIYFLFVRRSTIDVDLSRSGSLHTIKEGIIEPSQQTKDGEMFRDFLRNISAVKVLDSESYVLFEELIDLRSGEAKIINNKELALLNMQKLLVERGYDQEPETLARRIIRYLTVDISMEVLSKAQVSPPAMYQPRFTIALFENSIHVAVNAFVGAPVFGPPDPSKKYTAMAIHYITGNLAIDNREIHFKLVSTSKSDIDDCIQMEELRHSPFPKDSSFETLLL